MYGYEPKMDSLGLESGKIDKSKIEGKRIFWIMGGPGSGRALLAETLKSKMNYYHLSIGDLLQYELTHGSQRGEMLKEFMASGDSAPNHIVDEILKEAMVQNANKFEGFVIDGYPINKEQADLFCSEIAQPNLVICLQVSYDRALHRLTLNDKSEAMRKKIDKRFEIWDKETKPLTEKFKTVFISAETKTPSEVLTEVLEQIKLHTPTVPQS